MKFFDLHCDTAYKCYQDSLLFTDNSLAVTQQKACSYDTWHQCFAFFIKDNCPAPFTLYRKMYLAFLEKLKGKPKNLKPKLYIVN